MFKWQGSYTSPASTSVLEAALKSHSSRQIIAPSLIFLHAAPPSCCQQVRLLRCWHSALLPAVLSDLLSQQQPALALLQAVKRQARSERSSRLLKRGHQKELGAASLSLASRQGSDTGNTELLTRDKSHSPSSLLSKKWGIVRYPSPTYPIWKYIYYSLSCKLVAITGPCSHRACLLSLTLLPTYAPASENPTSHCFVLIP